MFKPFSIIPIKLGRVNFYFFCHIAIYVYRSGSVTSQLFISHLHMHVNSDVSYTQACQVVMLEPAVL